LTSSIYPRAASINFVGSVVLLEIANGGTGFTSAPTLIIDAPSGTTATATANISNGKVVSFTITNEGEGYTSAPVVTIAAPVSGTTATATANISNGKVISFTITNGGSGYTSAPSVTIAAPIGVMALAIASTDGDSIDSVTITLPGSGYTSAPNVAIVGGGGSGATINATIGTVESSTDLLLSDIEITSDMVSPGGGGILRLYFSFEFFNSPSNITVFNNSSIKGLLNADNASNIVNNGIYRFDIDVEADDNINLQSTQSVVTTNFIRAHLVQFGA